MPFLQQFDEKLFFMAMPQIFHSYEKKQAIWRHAAAV